MQRRSSWMVAMCAALAACGGNTNSPADATVQDAGTADAGPADGGVLDGSVGEVLLTVEAVRFALTGETTPAVGASLTLDLPDGTRASALADGQGIGVFRGRPWASGEATVTAYLANIGMSSLNGVQRGQRVRLPIFGSAPPGAEVRGTATNMRAATNVLLVTSSHASTRAVSRDGSFSLRVLAGMPSTLVGVEVGRDTLADRRIQRTVLQWATLALPAANDTVMATLDFARPVAPREVSGSFPAVFREGSPLRGPRAFGDMRLGPTSAASLLTGFATDTAPNSAGDGYTYTAQYIEVPGVTAPSLVYSVQAGPTPQDPVSLVVVPGNPRGGALTTRPLDLPTLAPPSGDECYPLNMPIQWTAYDRGVRGRLIVTSDTGALWVIGSQVDATSLRVPAVPPEAAAEYGAHRPLASFSLVEWDERSPLVQRAADQPIQLCL